jgi:hypothetical protein
MNQFFRLKQQILGPMRFMVAFVILLVIVTIILPEFAKRDNGRPHFICRNNLKQFGIAFRGFGIDIGGFPMLISNTNNAANTPGLVDARPTHFETR